MKWRDEWSELGGGPRKSPSVTRTKPVVRFLDLPGVGAFENTYFLNVGRNGVVPPEVETRGHQLSREVFGITVHDTQFEWPDDFWDLEEHTAEWYEAHYERQEFEAQFTAHELPDDEKVQHLLGLGWDFRDNRGEPCRTIRLFARQAEAVAKGIAGRWPDLGAARAQTWGDDLTAEREKFLRAKRRA